MCENVDYDHDAADNPKWDYRSYTHAFRSNGTYNALMKKLCVCEGYSRTIQYIMSLLGVYVKDVHCDTEEHKVYKVSVNGKRFYQSADHSIQSIELNSCDYFCDLTWDASDLKKNKPPKYFLLSHDEMSRNHKLKYDPKDDFNNTIFPRYEANRLLEFAKERIESVDRELKGQTR
jgi:hypothetical protein